MLKGKRRIILLFIVLFLLTEELSALEAIVQKSAEIMNRVNGPILMSFY